MDELTKEILRALFAWMGNPKNRFPDGVGNGYYRWEWSAANRRITVFIRGYGITAETGGEGIVDRRVRSAAEMIQLLDFFAQQEPRDD
jgi:hypothetical protein